MKTLLPLLALAVASCTMIPTQHGTAQFWGDYQDVKLSDGAVKFSAKQMVHSGVVRANWHGVIGLGGEAVAGFGGGAIAGPGAAAVSAFVNRPTNRATPTPAPAK